MNESKMIEVLAHVEDERARFAQREPGAVGFNMAHWFDNSGRMPDEASNICGTTACLAGHAYLMSNAPVPIRQATEDRIASVGARVLELDDDEEGYLFYLDSLDDVYRYVAEDMGVDVQVLRDKVQGERKS